MFGLDAAADIILSETTIIIIATTTILWLAVEWFLVKLLPCAVYSVR